MGTEEHRDRDRAGAGQTNQAFLQNQHQGSVCATTAAGWHPLLCSRLCTWLSITPHVALCDHADQQSHGLWHHWHSPAPFSSARMQRGNHKSRQSPAAAKCLGHHFGCHSDDGWQWLATSTEPTAHVETGPVPQGGRTTASGKEDIWPAANWTHSLILPLSRTPHARCLLQDLPVPGAEARQCERAGNTDQAVTFGTGREDNIGRKCLSCLSIWRAAFKELF